jgi:hemerythrin-like domain-containing protein
MESASTWRPIPKNVRSLLSLVGERFLLSIGEFAMSSTLNRSSISTAAMEHAVLDHIKQALRITLNWQAPEVSLPRKVSSLQFTIQSLQRHLDRLMRIEEEGGYLIVVEEAKPHLRDRLQVLAADHDAFRKRLKCLANELDGLNDWQQHRFSNLADELQQLLDDIDEHDRNEVELLQQSLLDEEGGGG